MMIGSSFGGYGSSAPSENLQWSSDSGATWNESSGSDITVSAADKGRVRAFGRVWDFKGLSSEICQIDWHGPN